MQTIELFSGTQSFSKVMRENGHKTFCIDNDPQFDNDITIDILDVKKLDFTKKIDMLWASPPCQGFSVATIGRNWDKATKKPKTKESIHGYRLLEKTVKLIRESLDKNPNMLWYIENPRGMMRVVIDKLFTQYNLNPRRITVTYCKYGDTRMKPTDIWTNDYTWIPKTPCKNGMLCHQPAPRGSKEGTQGLKNSIERAVIPPKIFKEILTQKDLQ